MFAAIEAKIKALATRFSHCSDAVSRYEEIIEIGRAAPPLAPEHKTPSNLVSGCQSTMHLHSSLDDNKIYFEADSDALISKGLASLLIEVYSGQPPEAILKHTPTFLKDLEIITSLSPTRANGLASLHLKMKQEALAQIV